MYLLSLKPLSTSPHLRTLKPLSTSQHIHSTEIMSSSDDQIRAAHLLIKHTGSRNPISRRTGQTITLSPEAAYTELQSFMHKIKHEGIHESFPKYASMRSDCSSYKAHGDLGYFGRGMMQGPFEDAAYALNPGDMSDIVSTDSGYHLIHRIA